MEPDSTAGKTSVNTHHGQWGGGLTRSVRHRWFQRQSRKKSLGRGSAEGGPGLGADKEPGSTPGVLDRQGPPKKKITPEGTNVGAREPLEIRRWPKTIKHEKKGGGGENRGVVGWVGKDNRGGTGTNTVQRAVSSGVDVKKMETVDQRR